MPLSIKGQDGSIRYGYQPAASVRPWLISKDEADPHYTLAADVVSLDAFRVSQRPLTFVVPVKGGSWRFPILSLQIHGTSLTATLGPKERT